MRPQILKLFALAMTDLTTYPGYLPGMDTRRVARCLEEPSTGKIRSALRGLERAGAVRCSKVGRSHFWGPARVKLGSLDWRLEAPVFVLEDVEAYRLAYDDGAWRLDEFDDAVVSAATRRTFETARRAASYLWLHKRPRDSYSKGLEQLFDAGWEPVPTVVDGVSQDVAMACVPSLIAMQRKEWDGWNFLYVDAEGEHCFRAITPERVRSAFTWDSHPFSRVVDSSTGETPAGWLAKRFASLISPATTPDSLNAALTEWGYVFRADEADGDNDTIRVYNDHVDRGLWTSDNLLDAACVLRRKGIDEATCAAMETFAHHMERVGAAGAISDLQAIR